MSPLAALKGGVDSVISLPAALWFQEISEAFLDAKVILTLRDSEDVWAQCWVKHIKYTTSYGGYGNVNRIALSWQFCNVHSLTFILSFNNIQTLMLYYFY